MALRRAARRLPGQQNAAVRKVDGRRVRQDEPIGLRAVRAACRFFTENNGDAGRVKISRVRRVAVNGWQGHHVAARCFERDGPQRRGVALKRDRYGDPETGANGVDRVAACCLPVGRE